MTGKEKEMSKLDSKVYRRAAREMSKPIRSCYSHPLFSCIAISDQFTIRSTKLVEYIGEFSDLFNPGNSGTVWFGRCGISDNQMRRTLALLLMAEVLEADNE